MLNLGNIKAMRCFWCVEERESNSPVKLSSNNLERNITKDHLTNSGSDQNQLGGRLARRNFKSRLPNTPYIPTVYPGFQLYCIIGPGII